MTELRAKTHGVGEAIASRIRQAVIQAPTLHALLKAECYGIAIRVKYVRHSDEFLIRAKVDNGESIDKNQRLVKYLEHIVVRDPDLIC